MQVAEMVDDKSASASGASIRSGQQGKDAGGELDGQDGTDGSEADSGEQGLEDLCLTDQKAVAKRPTGFLDLANELLIDIFLAVTSGYNRLLRRDGQTDRYAFCLISKFTLPAARAALYYHPTFYSLRGLSQLQSTLADLKNLRILIRHFSFESSIPAYSLGPTLDMLNLTSLFINVAGPFREISAAIVRAVHRPDTQLQCVRISTGSICQAMAYNTLRKLSTGSLQRLELAIDYLYACAVTHPAAETDGEFPDRASVKSNISYLSYDETVDDGASDREQRTSLASMEFLATIPNFIIGLRLSLWCNHAIPTSLWSLLPSLKHLAIHHQSDTLFTVAPESFPPALVSLWCERFEDYIYLDLPKSLRSLRLSTEDASIVVDGLECQNLPPLRLIVINEKYCNGEVEEETVEVLQAFCDARGIELCTEDVPQVEWYDWIRERESRYPKTA